MELDLKEIIKICKKIDVLYVEDNDDLRITTAALFGNFFNTVETSIDGQDALEKYKNKTYDLIISDINMPKMNGIDLAKTVLDINPDQELIFVSAHNELDIFLEIIKINYVNVLLKPINIETIKNVFYRTSKSIAMKKNQIMVQNIMAQTNRVENLEGLRKNFIEI